MQKLIFYEKNGKSELWDFLEVLRQKAATNKDARIQYKQMMLYIELLQKNGKTLPEKIAKYLGDDIWELRPGNNRVFYFFWNDKTCVLLHQFRKKTQKTPKRELEKAQREKEDFLERKERVADENME